MSLVRFHVWISGAVQGVFFRASARKQARKLGVNGWIKNLPDGRVECVVEGGEGLVDEFIKFLRQGPRAASVSRVRIREEEPEGLFTGFEIRY